MEAQGSVFMGHKLKVEYIEFLRLRYRTASKKARSQIISELCTNAGIHRKSAIRSLRQGMSRRKNAGRKKVYSPEVIAGLKKIWIASDQMCSKNLKAAMPVWISKLAVEDELSKQLLKISPASIDRHLKPYKVIYRRGRRAGTKPGKLLKHMIPIKSLGNIPDRAGHVEADTVAHCGGTLLGDFIWSLTFTDTFSGWTENRAVWGKHAKNVHAAIEDIEGKLPFDILSFNCDNGSEFLNHRLVEYFSEGGGPKLRKRFVMSRSRSYHKNDNAHVEQKNWTHVRQLFGYERFEFKELLPLMNEVYRVQNLLTNFFHPQMKLKSKVRVGNKYKKKYDDPKSPYTRLMLDPHVPEESKQKLTSIFNSLNPFKLREQREELLTDFFKLKRKLQSNNQSHPLEPLIESDLGNIFH